MNDGINYIIDSHTHIFPDKIADKSRTNVGNFYNQPMFTTGGEERSGLGFTIMESFMDKLAVRSVPGKGTAVVMKKRLAPRLKAAK